MKKLFGYLINRAVFVALLMLIQIAVLIIMIVPFGEYFAYFYAVSVVLGLVLAIYIVSNNMNPAYKIAWLIPVLVIPIFGIFLYLIFGRNKLSKREIRTLGRIHTGIEITNRAIRVSPDALPTKNAQNQSRYILDYAGWPLYKNTEAEYFSSGEQKFERMKEELRKARDYIFLEYFIVTPGIMWDSILEILEEKVKEGVEVRVMYDDLGTIYTLPHNYSRILESKGIKCCVFSPFLPVLTARFNNRDHQKICVIDGHTGITGGINLADEYINAYEKHGHWKDTAILLRGDGAWGLTMMFLSVWNFSRQILEDYAQYLPDPNYIPCINPSGYVQPFNDSPLDNEPVGETVYLNLISKAKDYVWIFTPYLIITSEMERALCNAAKSGIDVRIVTPHIADKRFVHAVTKDYYPNLIRAGVKIYEYTPGFIHAKTFLVDDKYGVVGTINLDFRSLYLHFECGVWLYETKVLRDMKKDYLDTLEISQAVSLEDCQKLPWYKRSLQRFLHLFAPLL